MEGEKEIESRAGNEMAEGELRKQMQEKNGWGKLSDL